MKHFLREHCFPGRHPRSHTHVHHLPGTTSRSRPVVSSGDCSSCFAHACVVCMGVCVQTGEYPYACVHVCDIFLRTCFRDATNIQVSETELNCFNFYLGFIAHNSSMAFAPLQGHLQERINIFTVVNNP